RSTSRRRRIATCRREKLGAGILVCARRISGAEYSRQSVEFRANQAWSGIARLAKDNRGARHSWARGCRRRTDPFSGDSGATSRVVSFGVLLWADFLGVADQQPDGTATVRRSTAPAGARTRLGTGCP